VQPLTELFYLVTLIKAATAILMVVFLSILAEVVSPRFAGMLSGYPLGAAISLFFMGFEISPAFASESALYTSVGLIATQVFAYSYYRASRATRKLHWGCDLALASLAGLAGYFVAASLLRMLAVSMVTAILLPTSFIIIFDYLFRGVENVKIAKRVSLNLRSLLFRSLFAAGAIVLITSTAKLVGPRWAGLFSAFPITMLPLVVIIHFTYGPQHVYSILKNVPRGLGSLVIYSFAVFFFYPGSGIYGGTAIAYALATIYLIVVQLTLKMPQRPRRVP
jgi:hypothetical protein